MKNKKFIAYMLVILMFASLMSGCVHKTNNTYSKFLTIDVFDSQANVEGIQSGWFAKIVRDRFNMELNIIQGASETVFSSRFAAGKIGDIIITSSYNNILQNMVDAGLVLDMSDYLSSDGVMEHFNSQINALNSTLKQKGIYALPSQLTNSTATTPSEGDYPTYGAFLRWDYYSELGYPKISTLEDLLPIIAKMQENHPTSDSGKPTYGFSLFPSWDNNMMTAIKQPCCFYGYDEYGFVLANAEGSDFQNILDKDSLYVRSLHFYNEAYKLGLMDPESRTQNYNQVADKFSDGQILFSPWPWLAQPAYNTAAHVADGKGFAFVPIEDELIYSNGINAHGNYTTVIAVGSTCEDPQRVVDFIEWLYSDEGAMCNGANSQMGTAGPEGLTWEMVNGEPVLTDFGRKALYGEVVNVPEEYGGESWLSGISILNYKPLTEAECNSRGVPFYYSSWDSVKRAGLNPVEKSWSDYYGSRSAMEYLNSNNQLTVSVGTNYYPTKESSELTTIRSQCADTIIQYSWNMVFCDTSEDFDKLYTDLVNKTTYLGYPQVLEYDMINAKNQAQIKKEILANE